MKKNHGYTMVELIIVMAIIAIMAGMSFVTIGVIQQAKYNEAASTLSNQMGALLVKTKALSEAKDSPLCMKIEQVTDSGGRTLSDGTLVRENSYVLVLGYDTGTGFVERESGKVEGILPNVVTVEYSNNGKSENVAFPGGNDMIIEFNKATGAVKYGAGKYDILNKKGAVVATVYLDATTGNHYSK